MHVQVRRYILDVFNPIVTTGLFHCYHLDESIFEGGGGGGGLGGVGASMKFIKASRIAPDGMPCFAASYLGLFCLLISHKKDARLIWVK